MIIDRYTDEDIAQAVYLRTGKNPMTVRRQALLVVAEFLDGTLGIWRIEELMEGYGL